MGQVSEYTFLQGRYTNSQKAHEKKFNIISHQRNANQSHNEIPLHISFSDRGPWYQ